MKNQKSIRSIIFIILAIVLPLLLAITSIQVWSVEPLKAYGFAVFITIVLMWLFELMPIAVSALLAPVLMVVYGVREVEAAFSPFGNSILFLFIGAFLLGISFQTYGFDRRISYWLLSRKKIAGSPETLILSFGVLSFIFSMWVSNTATVAMLTPIAVSLPGILTGMFQSEKDRNNFTLMLLLFLAYSSTIGGITTPVGSPPNLMAIGFLDRAGVTITFGHWMSFGLPIAFLMFWITYWILKFKFPIAEFNVKNRDLLVEDLKLKLKDLGPVKREEKQVAICFALTVFLWIFPDAVAIFATESVALTVRERMPIAVAALIGASLLFILPANSAGGKNLVVSDLKRIEWGTVILFGGGLSLGAMIESTGLARDISEFIFSGVMKYPALIALIAGVVTIFFTEIASNTASASIFLSVMLGMAGEHFSIEQAESFLMIALAASFAFMLPVATPPNAIVYSTEKVPLKEMVRAGIILNFIGIILISFFIIVLRAHLWLA